MTYQAFKQHEEENLWLDLCLVYPDASTLVKPIVIVEPQRRILSFEKDNCKLQLVFDLSLCLKAGKLPAYYRFSIDDKIPVENNGEWMEEAFYCEVVDLLNRHFNK